MVGDVTGVGFQTNTAVNRTELLIEIAVVGIVGGIVTGGNTTHIGLIILNAAVDETDIVAMMQVGSQRPTGDTTEMGAAVDGACIVTDGNLTRCMSGDTTCITLRGLCGGDHTCIERTGNDTFSCTATCDTTHMICTFHITAVVAVPYSIVEVPTHKTAHIRCSFHRTSERARILNGTGISTRNTAMV